MATIYTDETVPGPEEFLRTWLATQYWGQDEPIEVLGSYRFDDDQSQLEFIGFIVQQRERTLHIPVTYHTEPLEGSEQYLIAEVEHPAGGTRWVYDAMADPVAVHILNLALAGEIQQAEHYLYSSDGQYLGAEVPEFSVSIRGELPELWGYVSVHHVLITEDPESSDTASTADDEAEQSQPDHSDNQDNETADSTESHNRRRLVVTSQAGTATIFELTPPEPATKDEINIDALEDNSNTAELPRDNNAP